MQATNRRGEVFEIGSKAMMVDYPIMWEKMIGEELMVEDIKQVVSCESGFNILAKHVATGNVFKKWLDTNWFTKK
jgi:hypothetical protein